MMQKQNITGRLNLLLILLIMISYSCSSQKKIPTNSIQELNNRVENIFSNAEIAGMSIIVVGKGEILYKKSMGYADVQQKKSYTNQTIQSIASVSKTFIALALMKAVELGKLSLDDDINTYLPFKIIHPKYPNIPITVRQLTNHTSGIIDGEIYNKCYIIEDKNLDLSNFSSNISNYIKELSKNTKIDDAQFLKNMLTKNGKWYTENSFNTKAPGTSFNYSNVGAALAAFVLENAVNESFESFTQRAIFNPLKMKRTSWDTSSLNDKFHAKKYFDGGSIEVPNYSLITKADGGLITSLDDFGKYLQEVLKGYYGEGSILDKNSYKEMFTKNSSNIGNCGVFWEVSDKNNPNHNGGDPGIFSNAVILKDKEFGIFMMCNGTSEPHKLGEIFNTVLTHNFK